MLSTAGPFIVALTALVTAGLLDKESAFEELQRYGVVNPDKVWADIQGKIDLEPPEFTVPMPKADPAAE